MEGEKERGRGGGYLLFWAVENLSGLMQGERGGLSAEIVTKKSRCKKKKKKRTPTCPGFPIWPTTEAMLMMRPRRARSMTDAAALEA